MGNNDKKISLVIDGNPAGAISALGQVKTAASGFARETNQIFSSISAFGGLPGVAASVVGILAGGAMKAAIDTTKSVAGEVQRLSKTLGISAEEASYLRVALDDAFLTVDDMTMGTSRLTKQLLSNEDAFKKLGVQTRDSNGNYRDSVGIMLDVNEKLKGLKEGTDQNVAGMAIYGKGWGEVRGLLKLNSSAMEEAKKRAEELHLVFGTEGLKQVKEYKLAMKDLDDVTESFKVQIGQELIPVLTDLAVAFGDAGTAAAGMFAKIMKGLKEQGIDRKRWMDYIPQDNELLNWDEYQARQKTADEMHDYRMEQLAESSGGLSTKIIKARTPKASTKGRFDGGSGKPAYAGYKNDSDLVWTGPGLSEADKFEVGIMSERSQSAFDRNDWARRNSGTDMMAYQDQFDAAAFNAAKEATRQQEFEKEREFNAMRIKMSGNTTAMELLRIDQEQQAWEQSWAMQTDSFEVYETRKLQIEHWASAERAKVAQNEMQTKLGWTASGFQSMGSLAESFYNLSGKKSRAAFEAAKVMKIGETVTNTASAAMGAYNAMASIPYIGPVLGAAAAAAAIAAGAAQIKTINSQTPDGGSMPSDTFPGGGTYGSGTPTSPIVTQPVGALAEQGNVTIVLKGVPMGKWVEEELVPEINRAGSRNVRIEYAGA